MAPHADRLDKVGRDGFAIIDIIYRPRPTAQGTKNRCIPQQSHEAVRDTAASKVIDGKMASQKYKGMVIMENYKSKVAG
ncbi:hypothetical protein NL676_020724 [Syzygium grande]|nr:hypothetical protein NL676_020724 [Syzygium grande]